MSDDSQLDWRLTGPILTLAGFAYGSYYPSLVVRFAGRPLSREVRALFVQNLTSCCPNMSPPAQATDSDNDWLGTVQWLLALWQSLQLAQASPVYSAGMILAITPLQVRCCIPATQSSLPALALIIKRTLACLADGPDNTARLRGLEQAIASHGRSSASGSNVPRFVKAAYQLDLPLLELPGGINQYGVGAQARWLDSSFTDVTPVISARISRDKRIASAVMRQFGLPVPAHHLVADADGAVQAAHRLGYPVVVKPADKDGGVGVAAGLVSDDEVKQAFDGARRHSSNILVEKHIEGKDYRVTVFNGEAIWAIERVPAAVVGDGNLSVNALIAQTNSDPRRGSSEHSPLKHLVLDPEAIRLLNKQDLEADSVPASGQFVRLRRAANVASGGMPVAVFDQLHPDNAQLAVRAAQSLRLDLAGIDLLIPDIAVSWRQTGAAICEVNGQPNLGQTTAAHLYAPILKQLVPGRGRIPTVLLVGADKPHEWIAALTPHMAQFSTGLGTVCGGEVKINGQLIFEGSGATFHLGRMLVLNRQVDCMIISIDDDSILLNGLPVHRFDALILAGTQLRTSFPLENTTRQRWLNELLCCLLPACDGLVFTLPDHGFEAAHLQTKTGAAVRELTLPTDHVATAVAELLKTVMRKRNDHRL